LQRQAAIEQAWATYRENVANYRQTVLAAFHVTGHFKTSHPEVVYSYQVS
jgi:hypothetical protein